MNNLRRRGSGSDPDGMPMGLPRRTRTCLKVAETVHELQNHAEAKPLESSMGQSALRSQHQAWHAAISKFRTETTEYQTYYPHGWLGDWMEVHTHEENQDGR